MRTVVIALVVVVVIAVSALVGALAASGGSSESSASEQEMRKNADLWGIDQLEKNFHKATSKHDIDLMMGLWAPNASFTVGPGQTLTGRKRIRRFWLTESVAFSPATRWVSDTPAYKIDITVNGDKGTLHFECHYVDVKTHKVEVTTAADQDVARINGKWLITSMVGGSAALVP